MLEQAPSLEQIQSGEVFIVDKPLDWTSFDVVNKIRYALKKFYGIKNLKVGHAGTLDPKATGILIIAVGKKTKQIDTFQAEKKQYIAEITLGAQTPSYDTETEPFNFKPFEHISKENIELHLDNFRGKIMQKPPMFSAVSVNGQRLYNIARKGEEIDVPTREVDVSLFEILNFNPPKLTVKIECSKGTYIRSLAHQLGQSLACGAYLSALRRSKSGDFNIEQAFKLDDLLKLFSIKV